jgi:hypothetical protein
MAALCPVGWLLAPLLMDIFSFHCGRPQLFLAGSVLALGIVCSFLMLSFSGLFFHFGQFFGYQIIPFLYWVVDAVSGNNYIEKLTLAR